MSISRTSLLEEVRRLLGDSLSDLGYSLDENPIPDDMAFWFVKKPGGEATVFHIVEFNPGGFSEDDVFRINVRLVRRNFHDHISRSPDIPARVDFQVSLAPNMWQIGGAKLYYWEFVSLTEMQDGLKDILDKLLNYGIPFLENPASNYDTWLSLGTK